MASASSRRQSRLEDPSGGSTNIDTRIVLNVGGIKHETYKSTLFSIPDTRLYWLCQNPSKNCVEYDAKQQFYFFDRHPGAFEQIINFYRTGKLHCPMDLCGPMFEEELTFWGIDEKQIEPCCWNNYTRHRDARATIAAFEGKDHLSTSEETDSDVAEKFGIAEKKMQKTRWQTIQPKIWTLVDDPYSSPYAKVLTGITMILIVLSIIGFCLETHPLRYWSFDFTLEKLFNSAATSQISQNDQTSQFPSQATFRAENKTSAGDVTESLFDTGFSGVVSTSTTSTSHSTNDHQSKLRMTALLNVNDQICSVWFTIEFLVRISFCPNKKLFLKTWINIVDLLAVIPFYCQTVFYLLTIDHSETFLRFIEITKILRIVRVFKLVRHFIGLKVLVHTLRASAKELLLLIVFLVMGVIVFSSLMYYAEGFGHVTSAVNFNNEFDTIPAGFWWALVTMTTIGYGDSVPKTWSGRIIGALCAISGVLTISLPVPVIVNNFTLYYNHAQARLKLPKKKRAAKLAAAAPAFKSLQQLTMVPLFLDGGVAQFNRTDACGDTGNQQNDDAHSNFSGKGTDFMSTPSSGPKPTLGSTRLYSRNSQTKSSLVRTLSGSRNSSRSKEIGVLESPSSEVIDASPDLVSKKKLPKNKKKNFLSINRRYSINQAHLSAYQNASGTLEGKHDPVTAVMRKSTSFSNSKSPHEKSSILREISRNSVGRNLLGYTSDGDTSSDDGGNEVKSKPSLTSPSNNASKPTFISRYQGIIGSPLHKSPRSGASVAVRTSKPKNTATQQKRRISIFFETDDESAETSKDLGIRLGFKPSPSPSTSAGANDPDTDSAVTTEPKSDPMVRWNLPSVNNFKKDALGHTDSFKNKNEIELVDSLPRVRSQPVNEDSKPISLQRQTSYQEVDTRSRRRNSFLPLGLAPISNKSNQEFDMKYCKRERLRNSFPKTPTFDSVKEATVDSTQENESESEKDDFQPLN